MNNQDQIQTLLNKVNVLEKHVDMLSTLLKKTLNTRIVTDHYTNDDEVDIINSFGEVYLINMINKKLDEHEKTFLKN